MVYQLREEPQRCLTLRDEVFKKFIELFRERLKKQSYFRNGEDVFNLAKEVAIEFEKRFPKISEVFNGKASDCKKFFEIFTEKQLAEIRKLSKEISITVELKSFRDSLREYLKQNFELFKKRLKAEGYSHVEINEAWQKNFNFFEELIKEDTTYYTRIASLRIKDKTEKPNESDPYFLTYLLVFELEKSSRSEEFENLKESFFEGKIESIEETLKELVSQRWEDNVDDYLKELGIVSEDFDNKWDEKRKDILEIVENLFDAIDSSVRRRIEAEHFRDLIKFAKDRIEDKNLLEPLKVIENNLNLLDEIYENNTELGNTIVDAIPVGFEFWDKITDYAVEKDFRYFLYAYKMKINDIAEGAIENHLLKPKWVKLSDIKTRADYFIAQGILFKEIVKNLDKTVEKLGTDAVKKLPSYIKGFIKALFYYGRTDIETLERFYGYYEQVQVIVSDWLAKRQSERTFSEKDREFLNQIGNEIENLLKALSENKDHFEELYKYVSKNLLKEFIEKVLPFNGRELFVAVDFNSLAETVKSLLSEGGKPSKTRIYRSLLKVLTQKKELMDFEYIFRVRNSVQNHRLDLDREISPKLERLKPLKDLKRFFTLTAELSEERIPSNGQTYKLGFILSFFLLTLLIASQSEGVLEGFSLPHSFSDKEDETINRYRDLLYALIGASVFAINSDKVAAVQNFNWRNVYKKEPFRKEKNKNLYKAINNLLNTYLLVNSKVKNGLTSLYSNLPFEVEGLNLSQKVAILALSHPTKVDKNLKAVLGEAYIFEPFGGKDLFKTPRGARVFRKTFNGVYSFIEEDRKGELEDYKVVLADFLKTLKKLGVEKVYLIPPLPIYRGLSTKEDFLRKLYFSDLLVEVGEGIELPLRLVFSSFGIVYTPELSNFKRRIYDFLKKKLEEQNENQKGRKRSKRKVNENQIVAVNLFKNIEKITPRSGALPFITPKFAIIPLFSMEEGKAESVEKTLFHHTFIYSVPNHRLFEGIHPEKLFLQEEEKNELANLLSVVHLIQYQKGEELKKSNNKRFGWEKTFKRNPFYVFPERRSGDKNIFALTEVEIFFSNDLRPRFQTVLTAFRLWDTVKNP